MQLSLCMKFPTAVEELIDSFSIKSEADRFDLKDIQRDWVSHYGGQGLFPPGAAETVEKDLLERRLKFTKLLRGDCTNTFVVVEPACRARSGTGFR